MTKRIYILDSRLLKVRRITVEEDNTKTVDELKADIEKCLEQITFRWPTNYPVVTQAFRNNPAYYGQFKCGKAPFRKALPGHEGVDMRAYDNSPIRAVYPAVVKGVWADNGGAYGNQIRLESEINGELYEHTYAHLKSFASGLKAGDIVIATQVLGRADSTGNSTASHLHFMLKMKGATERGLTDYPCDIINPEPFFVLTR